MPSHQQPPWRPATHWRTSPAATEPSPAPPKPESRSSTAGEDAFAEGCYGAAGYEATAELPDGALQASLGCGNPVAVAPLAPDDCVLDLGSGGGIDVLLSARPARTTEDDAHPKHASRRPVP